MPSLEEFCVFRATIELLKDRGMYQLIEDTYNRCKEELKKPKEEMKNYVRDIYKPFTGDEINEKIIEMLRPDGMNHACRACFPVD